MDTKELIEKFVEGEITEAEFNEATKSLTPEEQENLKKQAEAKLPDAVEKLKSVRRGIGKISEEKSKPDPVVEQLRKENIDVASETFFAELGIVEDSAKNTFLEDFKKAGGTSINVPNIVKEMKAHYAKNHAEELLSIKQKQTQLEKEAEEFNSQNAESAGSGGAGSDKKVSKEVKAFIEETRKKLGKTLTPEQAERALNAAKNKGRIG